MSKRSHSQISIVNQATCSAPVNIACIKYWCKRDTQLILPVNSSLSGTLNQDDLKAQTTVLLSSDFDSDRLFLNGQEEKTLNARVTRCLAAVRRLCTDETLRQCNVHIVSKNNFPTAAGLASSAAGYACLVSALAHAFRLDADTTRLSTLARMGSGSACRSMFGGWVAWDMGTRDDGEDSVARQVADEAHWPEMRVLICVVSDKKKETSSTAGMQESGRTSALLAHRTAVVVPQRMRDIEEAIHKRDFERFAELTMRDSNQFHAICLDTYPPIFYMNDTSRELIRLVNEYNKYRARTCVAYTFDAGPNAVLYTLADEVPLLRRFIVHFFPPVDGVNLLEYCGLEKVNALDANVCSAVALQVHDGGELTRIISTSIGDGPRRLDDPVDIKIEYPGYSE